MLKKIILAVTYFGVGAGAASLVAFGSSRVAPTNCSERMCGCRDGKECGEKCTCVAPTPPCKSACCDR
jgi:hypothetical protein